MSEPRPMDAHDERDHMELALRAIRDNPDVARLIADTTLQLIEANRALRLDIMVSDE